MESQNIHKHTKENTIELIENWQIKNGKNISNEIRFDIEKNYNLKGSRLINAFERILRTDLACDLNVDDIFLEKIKKYINGL
jgi:hypothetical protein